MATRRRKTRNRKGQFVKGHRGIPAAAITWAPRRRKRKRSDADIGLNMAFGWGARKLGLPSRGWKPPKAVRGNRPSRFVVSTKTGVVSKTGSLTAARDDKTRAKRFGIKGVSIVDTKLGKSVRGAAPKKGRGLFG